MKKIFTLFLALVLCFSMFACQKPTETPVVDENNNGGGDPVPAPGPKPEKERYDGIPAGGYDGSAVTITFYHTMGEALRNELDSAIARFNEIYPNITVEHSQVGGYDDVRDQINKDLVAGSQPNVAYCYPDHVALYNLTGKVVPLDNFIESTESDGNGGALGFSAEQIANFIDGYYAEGTAFDEAGTMYTLPMSKSTEVMYYNKTYFEANGLKVPTTWAELEAVCAAIEAKDTDGTIIPLGYDSESNWFITMCEQYGSPYTSATGENFLFDNETNRGFVAMFRDWFQKKWVTTEELSGGYTSNLFTGKNDAGTRCYMCIGSTGGATYQQPTQTNGQFEFEVGITTMPQVNPEQPKVISQGPSICIFKNEDPQKVLASWLFLKFLTTDITFQASVSMNNGYAPVIQSVKENPIYAEFLASASTKNIQAYAVKVALEQSNAYYVSPAFNGSAAARDQVGLLMQKCLSDSTVDIAQVFKKAVEECKYQAGF